ncbi:MAG: hypothetical protein HUJ96_10615 [Marinilabiliaceae bacterium]|nr:hypothetical protein [Marinilabiliaceae bacterium]
MTITTIQLIIALGICVGAVVLTVYLFHRAEERRRFDEYRLRFSADVMPTRLQAYERMSLYLQRISPEASVQREQMNVNTAMELHTLLMTSIRQEFEHNMAMQIYISSASWKRILRAKEEVVKLLTEEAKETNPKASSLELGRKILEDAPQRTTFYITRAIEGLRADLAGAFVNK